MPFPIMPILKSVGGNRAGVFDKDTPIYGPLPNNAVYQLQHFEFEVVAQRLSTDTSVRYFANSGMKLNNRRGVGFYTQETVTPIGIYIGTGSDNFFSTPLPDISDNITYKFNGKVYNNNVKLYIDDGEVLSTTFVGTIDYLFQTHFQIGCALSVDIPQDFLDGAISTFKYFELNASGTRIAELVNLDWSNGGINTVPNIGADKPVVGDMTWVPAGSGTYVDI